MKTELECAVDYTENIRKIFDDLEKDRASSNTKEVKQGCTKILELHPSDAVKVKRFFVVFVMFCMGFLMGIAEKKFFEPW